MPIISRKVSQKLYEEHEKQKERSYNKCVIQVERATFTPFIFSTLGGMAQECTRYHKKIAELVANKTKEEYPKIMNHIRTRVRFTLLKSTLIAIRGVRGKPEKPTKSLSELSFNTIPEMQSYEI